MGMDTQGGSSRYGSRTACIPQWYGRERKKSEQAARMLSIYPRFCHANTAVLVGHNSLFILFGKDINGIARGEFHILDLDYWAWQGSFSLSHQNNVSLPTPTDPPDYDRHLAAGSIAAIVLGCVAAVSDA